MKTKMIQGSIFSPQAGLAPSRHGRPFHTGPSLEKGVKTDGREIKSNILGQCNEQPMIVDHMIIGGSL